MFLRYYIAAPLFCITSTKVEKRKTKMRTVLCFFWMLSTAWAQTPELNVKLVDYALSHLDQKVGHGVCRELVYDGLVAIGATMGDTVCLSEVKPGDIYFTGGEMTVVNGYSTLEDYRKVDTLFAYEEFKRAAKGRDSIPNLVGLALYSHISIVYKVLGDGRFMVLEQNAGKNLRESRVVISAEDLNSFVYKGVSRPVVDIYAHFIRPKDGVFDYENKIATPRLQMVGIYLSGLFSLRHDPFKLKFKYFNQLGDSYYGSFSIPGSWKCEESEPIVGNP